MIARTVCETALARAKFVRNSKFFSFFCDSCANFDKFRTFVKPKFFLKKIILNIYAVFMAPQHKPYQRRLYLRNLNNITKSWFITVIITLIAVYSILLSVVDPIE